MGRKIGDKDVASERAPRKRFVPRDEIEESIARVRDVLGALDVALIDVKKRRITEMEIDGASLISRSEVDLSAYLSKVQAAITSPHCEKRYEPEPAEPMKKKGAK